MGYKAQQLVRRLPKELKLTANSRRVLDYLAHCANEEDAERDGQYFAFPSERAFREELGISRATIYRALDELEFSCGFYLITRQNRKDARRAGYDLHVRSDDLKPASILERKQSAEARQSSARGKPGARKRQNTSQNETYFDFPETSPENVAKRDVITSQNETQNPKNTSQNETQIKECIGTTSEFRSGKGESAHSNDPRSRSKIQKPKTRDHEPSQIASVLDRYKSIWADLVAAATSPKSPESPFTTLDRLDAETGLLVRRALHQVGGLATLYGFLERPRDASFKRDEFLDFLKRHDPVLAGAPQGLKRFSAAASRASP